MKLTEVLRLTKRDVIDTMQEYGISLVGNRAVSESVFEIDAYDQVIMNPSEAALEFRKSIAKPIPLVFAYASNMIFRTIKVADWSYLGSPNQSLDWFFANCLLPDFNDMPNFPSVALEIVDARYLQQPISGLFDNSPVASLSYIPDDRNKHVSISKGVHQNSNDILIIWKGGSKTVSSTFELQDWCIDNGFEFWA
ncbi:hypothetical protein RsoM2USA_306 [Ralstonia phage RsoM2USA]|nr:hypothetical protein RsoM2USA_306 [Ralstonia phage RsoM2USA]